MYSPRFRLASFDWLDDGARAAVVRSLVEALALANVAWLRSHPATPALYQSGVRYAAEADDQDDWSDIPDVLRRGEGDCEDLAAWRIAELREREWIAAVPFVRVQREAFRVLYHVTLLYPDGREEDPSRALGMR